jgi:hypothetical protein
MVPMLIICLRKISVAGPVILPRVRLADSILDIIVAPTTSVVTTIGPVPLGSSLNEIIAALAGVVPIKQTPMSAIGMNSCFVFIFSLPTPQPYCTGSMWEIDGLNP